MVEEVDRNNNRRYYQIGGITAQVEFDLPITDSTFHPKFESFRTDGPGEDNIFIKHHFSLPDLDRQNAGKEVYRKAPWAIYKNGDSWVYWCFSGADNETYLIAFLSDDHTKVDIYTPGETFFHRGNMGSLTHFPSDQVLFARLLADRSGCYLHSGGVILDGKGLVFAGHSDAGKSTIVTMLRDKAGAEILCDDRIILRKRPEGFRAYGSWSHGDVPDVSGNSAPLTAILFLEQAKENRLIPFDDKREIRKRLLACLVRPLETSDWWEKMLTLVETMAQEIPYYSLRFDKSGKVADLMKDI